MDYNDYKFVVESMSGGKNTVILDDVGKPSIMVRIPKQTYASLGIGESTDTHPAWIVNGVEKDEIFVGKYQSCVETDRAYSLPNMDPRANLTFDEAKQFCENKGRGWHLMTNAEWAAIALWCKRNGFQPRGNTNYGASHSKAYERGVAAHMADDSRIGRVGTGSGPKSWAHDNSNEGIFDMTGNVWEWCGGLRLLLGEIQIIRDNNAADHIDQSRNSPLWEGILQDGSLVAPGTANTLKVDSVAVGAADEASTNLGEPRINTIVENKNYTGPDTDAHLAYNNKVSIDNIQVQSGVSIPDIMRALAVVPEGTGNDGDFWSRNYGERLPIRGGHWANGASAGIFTLPLVHARTHSHPGVGFRLGYVEL